MSMALDPRNKKRKSRSTSRYVDAECPNCGHTQEVDYKKQQIGSSQWNPDTLWQECEDCEETGKFQLKD